MEQVARGLNPTALLAGLEAEREALLAEAATVGGPAALVREKFPRLAHGCPPALSEEGLVGQTVAFYEDADARLGLCARCPPAGAACDGVESIFRPGQLPVWQGERVVRARCEKYRDWRLDQRLGVSNVPERYLRATFKNFVRKTPAQETAFVAMCGFYNDLVAGREPWLVVSGPYQIDSQTGFPTGTGKTHLGCAVLHSVPRVLPRKRFFYSDLNGLRMELKGRRFSSEEEDPMDRLRSTDLLVFDNVDVSRLWQEGWLKERVEGVLYERWNRRRATLIMTHDEPRHIIAAFPSITTLREVASCSLV